MKPRARMIEVEYKEQLEGAINGRTAMVYFLVADKHFGTYRDQPDAPGGKVSLAECVVIAKAARIPSWWMPRRNYRRRKTSRPTPNRV